MSYSYKTERPKLFTEDGMQMVIKIRDEAKRLIKIAGACTAEKALREVSGDSWAMLAALDYLVEKGDLRRIVRPNAAAQHQLYVGGVNG